MKTAIIVTIAGLLIFYEGVAWRPELVAVGFVVLVIGIILIIIKLKK